MGESKQIQQTKLLQQIKLGNRKVLNQIYKTYRAEFINWAKWKFHCGEEVAVDVFQETMIALYENVVAGRITEFSSSIKTYLFAIGRNLLLKRLRSKHPTTEDVEMLQNVASELEIDQNLNLTDRQKTITHLLDKLGEPCKTLLQLFYYQKYAVEAITQAMNYKNESVVKNQKVRCIKRLRKLTIDLYQKDDL